MKNREISNFDLLRIIEIQITNILGILEIMNGGKNKTITQIFDDSNFSKLKDELGINDGNNN